jgi:hypothetical protein
MLPEKMSEPEANELRKRLSFVLSKLNNVQAPKFVKYISNIQPSAVNNGAVSHVVIQSTCLPSALAFASQLVVEQDEHQEKTIDTPTSPAVDHNECNSESQQQKYHGNLTTPVNPLEFPEAIHDTSGISSRGENNSTAKQQQQLITELTQNELHEREMLSQDIADVDVSTQEKILTWLIENAPYTVTFVLDSPTIETRHMTEEVMSSVRQLLVEV